MDSQEAMQITLNGTTETLDEQTTVGALLQRLKLAPIRVAVEINEDVIARGCFADTAIQPGDRIEIVTFVGGG